MTFKEAAQKFRLAVDRKIHPDDFISVNDPATGTSRRLSDVKKETEQRAYEES